MTNTILTVVGLLIGLAVLIAGIFYLTKERSDPESRKIYTVVIVIGAVIVIALVLKIVLTGF